MFRNAIRPDNDPVAWKNDEANLKAYCVRTNYRVAVIGLGQVRARQLWRRVVEKGLRHQHTHSIKGKLN